MANAHPRHRRTRVRTLFLSDIHLGYRHARAGELNAFLHGIEAECIVLVGDIVDALALARRPYWNAEHTEVVRTLLARQRAGARLVYVPGNHDASLAVFAQLLQGQIEVHREWVHRTARGERLLVLHGDQFDAALPCPRWLLHAGDLLYSATVRVNHLWNDIRRAVGKPYWSLAGRAKLSVPTSVRFIEHFERLAARHAQTHGYDGVVCGHIHRANLRHIDGTLYCNTGDWVESCSALIEHERGALELVHGPHAQPAPVQATPALAPRAA